MGHQDQAFDSADPGLPPRQARRGTTLRGHILRASGQIVDIEIKDLSCDGCRIATPQFLWEGEAVRLSVPFEGAIASQVRWCKNGFAGLSFAAEAEAGEAQVERSERRITADVDVTLRRLGVSAYRVTVRDVSRRGCRIELVERPAPGEAVLIKFDGLEPLDSAVKWIDGFVAGVEFNRPIHPAVFDLLVARLPPAAR